jgi:hypothetical protein
LLTGLLSQAVQQFEREYGEIEGASDEIDPLELVQQSIRGFDRGAGAANGAKNDKTKGRRA